MWRMRPLVVKEESRIVAISCDKKLLLSYSSSITPNLMWVDGCADLSVTCSSLTVKIAVVTKATLAQAQAYVAGIFARNSL